MALFALRRVFASRQPPIPPEPQGTVLCRQPCYRQQKNPEKPTSSNKPNAPEIEVHPQRDRLVAILRQREAQIKARTPQAKVEQIPKPKTMPPTPKADPASQTKAKVAKTPMPAVQPDPSIARPPWVWSQPLATSA